jgi:uncharacterized protein (TIGR02466 family)
VIIEHRPFFVAVHTKDFDKTEIDTEALKSKILSLKQSSGGVIASNQGGWHSKPSSAHSDYFMKALEEKAVETASQLHSAYGISSAAKIQSYWFNVNEKYNYNASHHHLGLGVTLSGCFYVEAPENSGALVLERPMSCGTDEWNVETEYSLDKFYLQPAVGRFVLFPAGLRHQVQQNLSDKPRISVAFNFCRV